MKHPLTIIALSALCWAGFATSEAQAITVRVEGNTSGRSGYSEHHRSYDHGDSRHRSSRKYHKRRSVWVPGHYVWRNHHRVFIPGHSVLVRR
ncbi:MAG: hypothetical protein JWL59_3539 [Chthoniobacteraceae bacterium]|nr:hypothetical protein [Chthoniobacteraceae bacterium]